MTGSSISSRGFPATRDPRATAETYLALMELGQEATRRPELLASYTKSVRGDPAEATEFRRTAGLPFSDQAWAGCRWGLGSRHMGHIAGPSGRSRTGPTGSKPKRSYSLRLRALLASR